MGSFRRRFGHLLGKAVIPITEDRGDQAYLNWIRSLPCAQCHAPGPSQAHHSTVAPTTCEVCSGPPKERQLPGKRGKAVKSHDHYAFPLCLKCHGWFHSAAGPFKIWIKAQFRAWQEKLSAEYHRRYFDDESF